MIVVRLAGTSLQELYALLTSDNWELGMPVGVARWDGAHWQWMAKFTDYHLVGIKAVSGRLFLLDSGGYILHGAAGGPWVTDQVPSFSCRSFHVNEVNDAIVACDGGELYLKRGGPWKRIETETQADLYCIHKAQGQYVVCGLNGTLLRSDGVSCKKIESNSQEAFLHLDSSGELVFVGGPQSLLTIDRHNWSIVAEAAPSPVFGVAAVSESEVYCSTAGNGVLLWNGVEFRQVLSGDVEPGQVAKLGDGAVAVGSRNGTIYFNPPSWETLAVTLDDGYLLGQPGNILP